MIEASAIYAWLMKVWPRREQEVARQYRTLVEHCPLVLADLRAVAYGDRSDFVPGDPHASAHNQGMRAVWLHIQEQTKVEPKVLDEILNMEMDDE